MPQDTQRYLSPSAIERIFGRLLVAVIWIGLVRGHFYVLEVRGRKSGRTISLPVDPIEIGGRRYLVCARGNSNWVRNARAAGEVALVRALRRRHFALRELPPSQRPPVLKAYLDHFATEVQLLPGAKGIAGGGLRVSREALPGLRVIGGRRAMTAWQLGRNLVGRRWNGPSPALSPQAGRGEGKLPDRQGQAGLAQ